MQETPFSIKPHFFSSLYKRKNIAPLNKSLTAAGTNLFDPYFADDDGIPFD
jgi:hypothetical protein